MYVSPNKHSWDLSPTKAINLQNDLAKYIVVKTKLDLKKIKFIAGADVSIHRQKNICLATVVILSFPELSIIEERTAIRKISFPYVPGLLSFREGPVLLEAFQKIKNRPGLVLFDGQGIAHPRRFGLASHLGWWLEIPSIGIAKNKLIGEHDDVGLEKGSFVYLYDNKDKIGIVIRTRSNVKPVYVSPGFKVNYPEAIKATLSCLTKFRLPEPIRAAHHISTFKRKNMEE